MTNAREMTITDLSNALQAKPVAFVVMQAADVLAEFGFAQEDDTDQHAARVAKVEAWLRDNHKAIEEAMTTAAFDAMAVLADSPQFLEKPLARWDR